MSSTSSERSAPLSLDRSTGDVLLNDIVALYAASSSSNVVQPTPVMTPVDRSPSSIERFETLLENEAISCFVVGGEKRLCFPQVLNAVLRDIPTEEIQRACSDLNINTPLASPAQLETLKLTGVLPRNTASCGLITKSDAERLVNYLQQIRRPGQRLVPDNKEESKVLGIPVRHDCFGGARGQLFPDLYGAAESACLECHECGHVFRPEKFVVHSHHQGAERRTVHWGFDSANWRSYLRLQSEAEDKAELVEKLADVKLRYEPSQLAARQILATQMAALNRAAPKRKAEEPFAEQLAAKRLSEGSVYGDPSAALLAYYTSLARYQSLLQPPLGKSLGSLGGNAALASFLSASSLIGAGAPPPNTSILNHPNANQAKPSKAALAAVSGLLALSSAGAGESGGIVKPTPVKASPLSPGLSRSSAIVECVKGGGARPEPLKKHLLHAFAEEQRAAKEASEPSEGSGGRPESGSISTSSASEGEDGEVSLDRLLEKLVPGPESLSALRGKIAESQRNLEQKIDSLQKQNAAFLQQNSILQQENMLLKRQEKVRGLLGLSCGTLLSH